jgi:hypothetical protein
MRHDSVAHTGPVLPGSSQPPLRLERLPSDRLWHPSTAGTRAIIYCPRLLGNLGCPAGLVRGLDPGASTALLRRRALYRIRQRLPTLPFYDRIASVPPNLSGATGGGNSMRYGRYGRISAGSLTGHSMAPPRGCIDPRAATASAQLAPPRGGVGGRAGIAVGPVVVPNGKH